MGQRLGFDRLACPIRGAFELCKIQIPTYSPPLPGWGAVGNNIDRCISDYTLACKVLLTKILRANYTDIAIAINMATVLCCVF